MSNAWRISSYINRRILQIQYKFLGKKCWPLNACHPFILSIYLTYSLQEGGIQALLQMCRQSALNSIKPMALRTVANLCNTTEGRGELEKVTRKLWIGYYDKISLSYTKHHSTNLGTC